MRADRWAAGESLIRAGNPASWAQLDADTHLVSDNREAVDACRDALAKTGKAQRCVVSLAPAKATEPTP